MGLCCPFAFDDECDGAISMNNGPVALFEDRKAAKQAIQISANYARLRKSQGLPANDDFVGPCKKCIKIRPTETRKQAAK